MFQTSFKVMIITDENANRCRQLLGINILPFRFIEKINWIVWKDDWNDQEIFVIPDVVFQSRYVIVDNKKDYQIAERL